MQTVERSGSVTIMADDRPTMPIDAIRLDGRHRQDMGNIDALAHSIRERGLINAVTVLPDGRLIAGTRRLAAMRSLGWSDVPVFVAHDLDDARLALLVERDENVERKDFTPAEAVALGRALEELERPAAAERKGKRTDIQPKEKFSSGSKSGKVYDIVGEAVGMSGPTYKRAKAVVDAAEDTAHPEVQAAAREALETMNATGKVSPAYNRVIEAQDRAGIKRHRTTNGKPKESPEVRLRNARADLTKRLKAVRKESEALESVLRDVLKTASDGEIAIWMDNARGTTESLERIYTTLTGS